jgi:hypothetical protein
MSKFVSFKRKNLTNDPFDILRQQQIDNNVMNFSATKKKSPIRDQYILTPTTNRKMMNYKPTNITKITRRSKFTGDRHNHNVYGFHRTERSLADLFTVTKSNNKYVVSLNQNNKNLFSNAFETFTDRLLETSFEVTTTSDTSVSQNSVIQNSLNINGNSNSASIDANQKQVSSSKIKLETKVLSDLKKSVIQSLLQGLKQGVEKLSSQNVADKEQTNEKNNLFTSILTKISPGVNTPSSVDTKTIIDSKSESLNNISLSTINKIVDKTIQHIKHQSEFSINSDQTNKITNDVNMEGDNNKLSMSFLQNNELKSDIISKNNFFLQFIDLMERTNEFIFDSSIKDIVNIHTVNEKIKSTEDERAAEVVSSIADPFSNFLSKLSMMPVYLALIASGSILLIVFVFSWLFKSNDVPSTSSNTSPLTVDDNGKNFILSI